MLAPAVSPVERYDGWPFFALRAGGARRWLSMSPKSGWHRARKRHTAFLR